MSRLIRLAGTALVALTLALPAAPAVAAPSAVEDCLTVIGDTTIVDVALCIVVYSLPPDVRDAVTPYLIPVLQDPLARCAAGHATACDAVLCPALAQVPSVPGVLEVRPDGDVYVAGEFVWDCPPYEPTG